MYSCTTYWYNISHNHSLIIGDEKQEQMETLPKGWSDAHQGERPRFSEGNWRRRVLNEIPENIVTLYTSVYTRDQFIECCFLWNTRHYQKSSGQEKGYMYISRQVLPQKETFWKSARERSTRETLKVGWKLFLFFIYWQKHVIFIHWGIVYELVRLCCLLQRLLWRTV